MLPLVINHDGTARTVKLRHALRYLGVDINRPSHLPEMTPEEKIQRRKERRRRLQEQRETER